MAEWRYVRNTGHRYIVSDKGEVMNLDFGNTGEPGLLSPGGESGSLHKVVLYFENGKKKRVDVHRIVAIAFIPNPNHYKYVKHKGNKYDNSVDNLYWSEWG